MSIVSSQSQYPEEVTQILRNLKRVPPNSRTSEVCELLVVPLRPADYRHPELPMYFVAIDDDYRLAIEFETIGKDQIFRSACVQFFNQKNGIWEPIYPIREKFMLIDENGQKIPCSTK